MIPKDKSSCLLIPYIVNEWRSTGVLTAIDKYNNTRLG